jgi:ABC-type glycerol-3-phosphate transport system substrate-binding protein
MGAAAVAACGLPNLGARAPQQVSGNLLIWGWDSYLEVWRMTEAGFKALQPHVTVKHEVLAVPQGQSRDDLIIAAFAGGAAADIWTHDVTPSWQQGFVERKMVLALDEYYARLPNLKRVFPWARKMTMINGKTWGVPNEVEYIAVFHNKPVFEKLNVQDVPETWDGYLRLGGLLKAAGIQPQAQQNLPNYGHLFSLMFAGRLGRSGQEDILFREGRWDSEACLDVGRAVRELQAAGILPADPLGPDAPRLPGDFHTGKVGLWMTGTWAMNTFDRDKQNVAGFDYDHFPIPPLPRSGLKPQLAMGLGGGWHVNGATGQREAAAVWLDFQFAPENQRAWIEGVFEIPPVPFKPEDFRVSPGKQRVLRLLAGSGDLALNMMPLVSGTFRPYFWETAQALLEAKIGVSEWGARLQQRWEQEKREGKVPKP